MRCHRFPTEDEPTHRNNDALEKTAIQMGSIVLLVQMLWWIPILTHLQKLSYLNKPSYLDIWGQDTGDDQAIRDVQMCHVQDETKVQG